MATYTDRKIWARECEKRGAVNCLYEKTTYDNIPQNRMLMYATGARNVGLYGVWSPCDNAGIVYDKPITGFDTKGREFHSSKIGES